MNNEEKYRRNMKCLDKWMLNRERGKRIGDYLHTFNIQRIGIYGYGLLGKHLVKELKKQDFNIEWVMDKAAIGDEAFDPIVRPNCFDSIGEVDMAIITPLTDVEEIEKFLLDFVTGRIVALDELVDAVYAWSRKK